MKSLKNFILKPSIVKEVAKWSFLDCKEYIEKHSKDSKQSPLLKFKMITVSKHMAKNLKPGPASSCKDWAPETISTYIAPYAPKPCQDSTYPQFTETLQRFKFYDTGAVLWASGYLPLRLIGVRGFGCVWDCGGKAVKVMTSAKAAQTETLSAKKLAEIISNDKEKAQKYFNILKPGKNSDILESALALCDLDQSARERVLSKRAEEKDYKTIASTLRQMRQLCKSLILFHKNGYSHNDVKPANMLKIPKTGPKLKQSEKDGKVHKNRSQLADFGGMTKIPQSPEEEEAVKTTPLTYTPMFYPDDMKTAYTKEAVEKRDVFAVGATLLYLLVKKAVGKNINPKDFIKNSNDKVYPFLGNTIM